MLPSEVCSKSNLNDREGAPFGEASFRQDRHMEPNLDGITLLRYANIFRDRMSGGAEQYLRQLNEGLLAKYRMTILQMYLVPNEAISSKISIQIEKCGHGKIVWIPVQLYSEKLSPLAVLRKLHVLATTKSTSGSVADCSVFSLIQRAIANSCGHLRYSDMILSEVLLDLFVEYRIDLIIFHWLSYDVGTLISHALRHRIPYAVINHFDNSRLGTVRVRRLMARAAAVGGVSNRNVPLELQNRYVNLSDGVDAEFFSPSKVRSNPLPGEFVVLLPSRIVSGKGHLDLLLAVKRLVRAGSDISLVFAGAVESPALKEELECKASIFGIRERITFLGELTQLTLRDWYAQSDVVVLPSSSEGLGRVLLEAQAMGKPVIAYSSGGMPDALVSGKTGFVVKVGDDAALSERLKYLIDNPAERIAMGESGRSFILETFSVQALLARHERFCARVLSEKPA